jgi:hypothetical protein
MDELDDILNDEQLINEICKRAVDIFRKDVAECMTKWVEVQGLSVTFKSIVESKNSDFQITNN